MRTKYTKYAIEQRWKSKKGTWKNYETSNNSLSWVKQQAKLCAETWPKYEWRICKVVETLEEIEVIK